MVDSTKDKENHLYSTLFLGDEKVGKTSITVRYTDDSYTDDYCPTIAITFHPKKEYSKKLSKNCIIQLMDTSGQEKYKSITKCYYKDKKTIIIVYDLTNLSSFNNIKNYLVDLEKVYKENKPKLIFVGNKIDLVKNNENMREVSYEIAKQCADNYSAKYFEVSAKTGESIDILFEEIFENLI